MTNKKKCNKLKIIKNKRSTDFAGMFTYVFEWYDGDQQILQEVFKLTPDIYNMPIEHYNVNEMIEHKKVCCMVIDSINIEEIEL